MTAPGSGEPRRRIWAAVAFKGTVGGKRRLAGLLDESERAALGLAMLDDLLDALLAVRIIKRVLMVTPDEGISGRRHDGRLRVVPDASDGSATGESSLNAAFAVAQRLAAAEGVTDLLLLPADLPLVSRAEIEAVLRAGGSPGIVLTPDRAASGTNALLLRPPTALTPSFGDASFERHRRLAADAGLEATIVRRPRLALDLDTPDDIAALLAGGLGGRTRCLLLDLDAERRLDAVLAAQARSATI